jgi:ATP-dependent exoDNAse (exonuclease V) alpha subunit
VHRDHERSFARGDRVQITAPFHEQRLSNCELGTVEQIDKHGNLKLKMDSGCEVAFSARQHPHLDYGYTLTSHSSQGQTADRVLIHVDSSKASSELLNRRMACVSVSRAQFDVRRYTNDSKTLGQELSRNVRKTTALPENHSSEQRSRQKIEPETGARAADGTLPRNKTRLGIRLVSSAFRKKSTVEDLDLSLPTRVAFVCFHDSPNPESSPLRS